MIRAYYVVLLCLLLVGCSESDAGLIVRGSGGGGPVTYGAGQSASVYDADTTLDVTISVEAGDLLAVTASNYSSLDMTGISDSATNSYTSRTQLTSGSSGARLRSFYCLSATSTTSLTITVTFGAGTYTRSVAVAAFRPASGESGTLDCAATATSSYEASPWETDSSSSTTGSDVACFAYFQSGSSAISYTTEEIPNGTAADGVIVDNNARNAFYSILEAPESNIEAETNPSATNYYVAEMMCFKFE